MRRSQCSCRAHNTQVEKIRDQNRRNDHASGTQAPAQDVMTCACPNSRCVGAQGMGVGSSGAYWMIRRHEKRRARQTRKIGNAATCSVAVDPHTAYEQHGRVRPAGSSCTGGARRHMIRRPSWMANLFSCAATWNARGSTSWRGSRLRLEHVRMSLHVGDGGNMDSI